MSVSTRSRRQRANEALEDNGVARCMRVSFAILSGYLALSLVPLAIWTVRTRTWLPLVVHLTLLGISIVLAARSRIPSERQWLDWVPLVAGPFLYIELRWIIEGAGLPHRDPWIKAVEGWMFASDPSATLAVQYRGMVLSEFLHFCYLAYFGIVFLSPMYLWARAKRIAFAATIQSLVLVYTACFLVYIVLPVDGPRFLRGAADAPSGPIRTLVIALLESASSRGTAFPSSHVAAAVVATVCVLRFHRVIGAILALLTAGLSVGAVYGGFHYAVDVLAGIAVGVVAVLVSRYIEPGPISLLQRSDPRKVKYDVVKERIERRKTAVKDRMRDWRQYLD